MSRMASVRIEARSSFIAAAPQRRQRGGIGTSLFIAARSGLGLDDLAPELRELLLVARPDLLLRELAESIDIGGVHRHSLGLEQRLRLLQIVDALGLMADLFL